MTMRPVTKEFEIAAGDMIFNYKTDIDAEQISPNLLLTFVEFVSLDGPDGDPVAPDAGTYTTTVQQVPDGNHRSISDGGVIDAALTGGSASPDGTDCSASFSGHPHEIKIVPAGVTIATHVRITVTQTSQ